MRPPIPPSRRLLQIIPWAAFVGLISLSALSAAPRVYGDKIEPNWFATNSMFWYRNSLPAETLEFILIDTRNGSRQSAFDHVRAAAALSIRLDREISQDRLPVDRLEFSEDLAVVTLSGPDGSWRLNLASYELEAAEPSEADSLPAEPEVRPSRGNGPETSILFDNRSGAEVRLYWIDAEGNRQPYGTLKAGSTRRQHTFAGHVWAAELDASRQRVFEATRASGRAIIEDREPEPRQRQRRRQADATQFQRDVRSPDGARALFVRDHNLWVRDIKTAAETQLSYDGSPGHTFHKDSQRARLVGMDYDAAEAPPTLPDAHWSPDSIRVVALQTRTIPERHVQLIESSPSDQLQPKASSYPYLKAGDELPVPNPRLFVVDGAEPREIPIQTDLFPNPWSLGQFRWSPDNPGRFTFLHNQRGHQVLRLLAVDGTTGEVTSLVEEKSATFIDYSNKTFLEFLDADRELVWMSERSGWNHLHLVDARSGAIRNPITRGDWVVRGVDKLDAKARHVWIRVSGIWPNQDPYHVHLARVNLDGGGFVALTEGDGTHEIEWSPDREFFIDTWSRVDLPPISELRNAATGNRVCLLETADASEVVAERGRLPERFVAKGRDGTTDIWGILHRPRGFDPAGRYPVIEHIYAGPHGQHVPKSFRATYGRQEELADRGFVVAQIDGMGTNWRSKRFHDVASRNLGDAGFPDRIAWLRAAAARFPELDLSRVGIYGGSAGGQNALRALLAHGDFYQAAVADCGCHDNRMDKIWWNEAWMGWPVGPHYAEQSNVTQAHKLRGKLLLTVGELDRNVDPSSTFQVVNALIKAGKPFEFLPFPGAGHGAIESDYGRRLRGDFFVRALQSTPPELARQGR